MDQTCCVTIINNNRLFSETILALLHQQEDIFAISSVVTPNEILQVSNSLLPNVILVDATMESVNAIQVIQEIRSELPDTKVIALGLEAEEEIILRMIEAGASGYILKESSFAELMLNIRAIHHGQTLCPPRITSLVFARIAELSRERSRLNVCLTMREHEILQLMATRSQNSEIAQQLGITVHTVKNHVHNILDKFKVHKRREVIQYAYESRMIN